jgi:predicted alpha/beta superfamily hydrolase
MSRHGFAAFCAFALCVALSALPVHAQASEPAPVTASQPLSIGETFSIDSRVMGETRRINVYLPAGYHERPDASVPVIYMPDGGIAEDFLHVAGLMQVSMGNGTMRPFMLVGIENTQRRRDMTGPTDVAADRKIAPVVGGSATFRAFIRHELMPEIARRYRTTGETAIVGESAAGLFVMETLVLAPELFDAYIAIDPSLWWNDRALAKGFGAFLEAHPGLQARLFLAHSSEPSIADVVKTLPAVLEASAPKGLRWHYLPLSEESHGTVYHPAALRAFRVLFAPEKR